MADATKTQRRLAESGFRMRPVVELQRPVETEDGSGTAAFTVARVEPGEMAEGRIQALTHHTESVVWQPRWLAHPNGALRLASVTIVVADLAEAAARFARFTGRQASASSIGHTIHLDRGRLDLTTPYAFMRGFPDIEIPSLPFIGSYGIKVKSLTALQEVLTRGGLKGTTDSRRELLHPFPDELGKSVWLFEE